MRERRQTTDTFWILTASFCYMCCTMMVTPIIAGYAENLGGSGLIMGIIGGLMTITSLFCRPIAGCFMDKIDKFRVSLAGAILILIACVGYCFAPSILGLTIARIINGIGYACCSAGLSTWLSLLLPKDKVGAGIGYYGTMQAISMAVTPSIGIRVKDAVGHRVSFLIAGLFVCITILAVFFVKDHAVPEKTAMNIKLRIIDWHIAPIALGMMLFTIPYSATQSFFVSYIAASGRALQPDIFFTLYAFMLIGLRVGLRNYYDKIPYLRFYRYCVISALLMLFFMATMQNYISMFFAAVFMAGSYGIMCSVSQSTAILIAGPEKCGLANSTYYIGLDLGLALGPVLGGLLYEHLDVALFYPVLGICPLLGICVYFLCRYTYRHHS